MVSLWPFGRATDETANFEKTLSTLTTKIQKTNIRRDRLRNSQRRYKALWTLYTTLAYVVCFLILALVTGWRNWGPVEYSVIAGAPPIIYLIRTGLTTYYTSRLTATQSQLDDLNSQRDAAIEKFKTATKYNSTQQLLEKYGAAPPTPKSSPGRPSPKRRTSSEHNQIRNRQPMRTNMPPPPTANIRRPQENFPPPNMQRPNSQMAASPRTLNSPLLQSLPPLATEPSASFAPNAFPSSPQYATATGPGSHGPGEHKWYDRIMDVLLGEDESRPMNRIALICQHCRLVNGQAPPGVKSLEEIGRWRCAECHRWNGKVNDVQQILQDVKGSDTPQAAASVGKTVKNEEMTERSRTSRSVDGADDEEYTEHEHSPTPAPVSPSGEADVGVEMEIDDQADAEDEENEGSNGAELDVDAPPPARSTRSRTKGKR